MSKTGTRFVIEVQTCLDLRKLQSVDSSYCDAAKRHPRIFRLQGREHCHDDFDLSNIVLTSIDDYFFPIIYFHEMKIEAYAKDLVVIFEVERHQC